MAITEAAVARGPPPYTADAVLSPIRPARHGGCLQNEASVLADIAEILEDDGEDTRSPGLTSPLVMPDWVSDVMKATQSSR